VFYQDDNYGLAGLKGTEIAMTKRGLKIHATGTYVTWFYPFLLLGLFLPARPDGPAPSVRIVDSACPSGTDHQLL